LAGFSVGAARRADHLSLGAPARSAHARPEAEVEVLRSLESRISTRLELGPLDEQAFARLASAFCGGPVDPAVVSIVQEQTGGNPFFIHEMLRSLRDSGKLSFDGALVRLATADAELSSSPRRRRCTD
jgi:predicted ATPase